MHIGLSRTFWDGPYHRDVADSGDIFYRRVEKTIEPDMLEQRTSQTTLEPQRFVWVCLSQRKLEPELGF